ncbi:MAG: helix-turn-helix domain-containing protein [Ilumatobacteraceae bacterium]
MTVTETSLTPRQVDIVDAAMRVFADHGFRGGTVQLIAQAAGLSQPGLIHHFPTKEAILMAVLEHRDVDDRVIAEPAIVDGANVVEVYRRILIHNAERSDRMRFFAVMSAEALSTDHPAHDYFKRRFHDTVAATKTIVRANQTAGSIRDDLSADAITELVLAAAHGFRYAVLVGDDLLRHLTILDALEHLLRPADQPASAHHRT